MTTLVNILAVIGTWFLFSLVCAGIAVWICCKPDPTLSEDDDTEHA